MGKVISCKHCGELFERVVRAPQKYCTPTCRIRANQPAQNILVKKCHQRNPTASILRTLKHRAKKKGQDFTLTKKDIVIPEFCPVFGFKLEHNWGKHGGKFNSPSVDRIDNTKGYTPDNIQIISRLANAMKSEASPEQLLMFADWIYKCYKESNSVVENLLCS